MEQEKSNTSIVLVTGANSGIGYAQARMLLRKGYTVVGMDKNFDRTSFDSNLKLYKDQSYRIVCNLANEKELKERLQQIRLEIGVPSIILNTAGVLDNYASIFLTDLETFKQTIDVNLTATFIICKEFIRDMKNSRNGIIINMSSIAGKIAGGGGVSYTASKHAIEGLTKQLAVEMAPYDVRVNCIAPGAVATRMTESDFRENNGEAALDVARRTPLKRYANAKEIAALTWFLISSDSNYIVGQSLTIDGGWSLIGGGL